MFGGGRRFGGRPQQDPFQDMMEGIFGGAFGQPFRPFSDPFFREPLSGDPFFGEPFFGGPQMHRRQAHPQVNKQLLRWLTLLTLRLEARQSKGICNPLLVEMRPLREGDPTRCE